MFCEKCGTQVMQGEKFCRSCGNPVSSGNVLSQQESTIQPNVPPVKFNPPSMANQPYVNSPVTQKKPQKQKKAINKKVLIPAVILFVIIIAAVIAGIIFLSSNKVERDVNEALNSKSYSVLSDTLVKYMGSDDANEADKCVAGFIDNVTKTVNDEFDSTVTDEKDWENIDTLIYEFCENRWGDIIFFSDGQKSELFNLESVEIQEALYRLEAMFNSKECYYTGLLYLNYPDAEDDYFDAVEDFSEVLPDDKNYSAAVEKTGEAFSAYMSLADQYIADGDWSAAISLLETANEWCEEASEYLGDFNEESGAYVAKLNEVKKNYAAQYAQKAEEYFKAGDIDAAIGSIEAAISIDPEGGYDAKLSEYKMYLPLALYDENNVLSKGYGISFEKSTLATNNKEYLNCISYRYTKDCDPSKVSYYLEGKYDTVSGICLSPKVNAEMDRKGTAYFEVYGDGKLLYTSPKVQAESLPFDVSFSVKDVQKLEIKFIGSGSEVWGVDSQWYGDYIEICDLTARKNMPQ